MSEQEKHIKFIKEVAKYFMDFLETDFHKKKAPKRSISYTNSQWYLVGVSLAKYEKITNVIRKTINEWFDKDSEIKVKKWNYTTSIPKNFLDVIKLNVNKFSQDIISEVVEQISKEIFYLSEQYNISIEEAIYYVKQQEINIFKEFFVTPFVENIKEYVITKKIWDESSIFTMENDLAENLVSWIEDWVNWLIKQVIVEANDKHWKSLLKRAIWDLAIWWNKGKDDIKTEQKEEDKKNFSITSVDVKGELNKIISLEKIKNLIILFFENFKVWDLYLELAEINRNKMIMDKQEFYLYFWDITYEKNKYPLFYIPIKLNKNWESFEFMFWSQIYVNKKALEYIVQEYNLKTWNSTHLKNIWERILYVADWKEVNSKKIQDVLGETIELLKLNQRIDIMGEEYQVSKWEYAQISTNCYICLFDKSDEALINDYEEIITKLNEGDSELWNWFSNLINDFIYKDPKKVTFEIKSEWEDRQLCDKLVAHCPIPLNQEQQQIVEATKREDCKYIIVQGPPGTWKSHTITAVVFDQILRWNSVLVLSDKKEALDVVEDKITETMNTVRINDDFQNPILRLWKTGNTYAEILSQQHIEKIINSYFVARWKEQQLKETMNNKTESLKRKITLENEWYKNILIQDIRDFFLLKDWLRTHWIDLESLDLTSPNIYSDLKLFEDLLLTIQNLVDESDASYKEILGFLNITLDLQWNFSNISSELSVLDMLLKNVETLKSNYDVSVVKEFWFMDKNKFEKLKELSLRYERERSAVFWYLFKKKILLEIRRELEDELWYTSTWNYDKDVQSLRWMIKLVNKSLELKTFDGNFDYIQAVFKLLKSDELCEKSVKLSSEISSLDKIQSIVGKYTWIFEIFWISWNTLTSLKWVSENVFGDRFDKLLEYLRLNAEINQKFAAIEDFDYNWEKQWIETLATVEMTRMMDESLAKFYEEKKNTAMSIKKIIQKKVKFPKEEFLVLKNAFPCILAWIRDYAEFIPLEPDMFDIVIIDEASQVSIAQAFPALLRAKKMLVLWDKKQFSNVKTSLASIKENREYLNKIKDSFIENISNNEILLEKSEMFNIKNSILDFCERICNYEMMLKKYFRWYKEIISYSNKTFYGNGLQVMKIRWKNIDDVLRFEFVDATWKDKTKENTNSKEIEFIIEELKKLKESWIKKSIWIITPHTNQQKALEDAISAVPWSDYFYEKFNLKIMTFDSCQWEERDVIYYSMVATREEDNLRWVFIKDLASVNDEENWILKSQRLNVWFSRPKESIVFVLSKPIEEYSGEIRKTLNHFWEERENNLENSDFVTNIENSEYAILKQLSQTDFYKEHNDNLKIIPNFDLSSYLKQLDPYYNHPKFKQDFFIVYTNEKWKETKIIFEYDDLNSNIENWNSELYVSENDIYMEKVLESYWYKFIRLNEFSLWKDKIDTLNQKMKMLIWEKVEKKSEEELEVQTDEENDWAILEDMQIVMKWLEDWTFKICDKCGEVKEIEKFKDNTLKSWYWRQCLDCKLGKRWNMRRRIVNSRDWSPKSCPICWSEMVLRHSKYWDFYGCSKYPRCLGIVSIKKGKYIKF